MAQPNSEEMLSAGIDVHKRDSVVHVLDADGNTVKKGRLESTLRPRGRPKNLNAPVPDFPEAAISTARVTEK